MLFVAINNYKLKIKIRAIIYKNKNMNEEPDESLWQGFKGRKCLQKDFNEDVIVTPVVIAI